MKLSRRLILILVLIILFVFFRFVVEIGLDKGPESRFRIVKIIDGDTFELSGGERLRLVGIDCPERGEPFYDTAIIFAQEITQDKSLDIKFSDRRRDRYGRLLGYAYIDSIFINLELVKRGLAHVYLFKDNLKDSLHTGLLIKGQNQAMRNNRGIWSISYSPEPYYIAGRSALRFHRPQCISIVKTPPSKLKTFDSRNDAFRHGLSPCRNCRP